MPPRLANSRQSNKRQAQDRDSPATSVDVSLVNQKTSNAGRGANGGTANGTATAGNLRKRGAQAVGGENAQTNKRKKVDGTTAAGGQNGTSEGLNNTTSSRGKAAQAQPRQETPEPDDPRITVDFSTLPTSTVRRYLEKYDLVPPMYPSPHTQYTPALPQHLLNPPPPPTFSNNHTRSPSPHAGNGATTANRPKRDHKRTSTSNSRRSTRLAEDEFNQAVYGGLKEKLGKPIMNDVLEAEKAYSSIAKRHWDTMSVKEAETIEAFCFATRNKDRILKVATPAFAW